MDKDFLKDILLTPSVSGHEEAVQKKFWEYEKAFADDILLDTTGTVIAAVNPDAPMKVLLMGHADEIGYVVSHIQEDGMVRVQEAGGVRSILYVGTPMQIIHNGVSIPAVAAVVKDTLKKGTDVSAEDLVLDIGASSKEEALKVVAVGDMVLQDSRHVRDLLNDNFSCKSLDDRTGAFVVAAAAKLAKEMGAKVGVYAATTCGEETTGRGAFAAAGLVKPTCSIAVDVTWANDCPGTDPASSGDVKLGQGPVLCHGNAVNKKMNALLCKVAEENGIKVQWEVAGGRTYTDGDTVSHAQDGVPMALVSIPLRYMHSSVEVGNYKDLEGAIQLLAQFLLAIDESFDFCPLT